MYRPVLLVVYNISSTSGSGTTSTSSTRSTILE